MSYLTVSSCEAFWNLALECSLRRSKRKCWVQFDSPQCDKCRIYLRKYTQASESAIQMLLLQTDTVAHDDKIRDRLHHVKYAALLLIFIGLAVWGWRYDTRFKGTSTPFSASTETSRRVITEHAIDTVLAQVDKALRRGVDVNSDGLVNCIDAAVLFYQYFPDKSKVCIELNYNTRVNPTFNHLFNCVLINGTWKAVEPQAHYLGKSKWMASAWGFRYDKMYNTDDTQRYIEYVK